MTLNTCGNCPYVEQYKIHNFTTTFCGKTGGAKDGLIVPHEYDGVTKTLTYTRVPEFCENADAKPSNKPAPKKDWVAINLNQELKNERY